MFALVVQLSTGVAVAPVVSVRSRPAVALACAVAVEVAVGVGRGVGTLVGESETVAAGVAVGTLVVLAVAVTTPCARAGATPCHSVKPSGVNSGAGRLISTSASASAIRRAGHAAQRRTSRTRNGATPSHWVSGLLTVVR